MYSGCRTEGVVPQNGIVGWQRYPALARNQFAVVGKTAQVGVVHSGERKVHKQEIHLHVADPLADAHRRGVDAVGTGLDCRKRVGKAQAPVPMAMPIEFHVLPGRVDDLSSHESDQGPDPGWRRGGRPYRRGQIRRAPHSIACP